VPFSTKHIRYSLDVTARGHHYLIQQDITCSEVWNLSMGGSLWQRAWHASGNERSAVDIGDDLVILVIPRTDCWEGPREHEGVILVMKHPLDPEMLYWVYRQSAELAITVNREWTSKGTYHWTPLAPSKSQIERARNAARRADFVRVTANTCPRSKWKASSDTESYFSSLTHITPAPSKAMPNPNFVDDRVYFPKWDDCPVLDWSAAEPLVFDGNSFSLVQDKPKERTDKWYPIRNTGWQPRIRFGDTVFPVARSRELYDPETQTMYVFDVHLTNLGQVPGS